MPPKKQGKQSTPVPEAPPVSSKTVSSKDVAVKYYLLAYNIVGTIGWLYVFISLVQHFVSPTASPVQPKVPATATSTLFHYLSSIPFLKSSPLLSPSTPTSKLQANLRPLVAPYFERASTAYVALGERTAWVQTLALMEIVHVLLGLVNASLITTVMQVFSRITLVWGIVEPYGVAQLSPVYATMAFAWAVTEVIRYSFYASSLVDRVPYALLYLRYTTFFVLYPIGAGSEAVLIYYTLPMSSPWSAWTLSDYYRGSLVLTWLPALIMLYTHMMQQRRKVLGVGQGRTLGSKKLQ